jgi:hypothetical protein
MLKVTLQIKLFTQAPQMPDSRVNQRAILWLHVPSAGPGWMRQRHNLDAINDFCAANDRR